MLKQLLLAASLSVGSSLALAEETFVHAGFATGQQYLEMPEASRVGYAMGLLDGAMLAPLWGGATSRIEDVNKCLAGMSETQVASLLKKYLDDNPGKWHYPASLAMLMALQGACGRNLVDSPSTHKVKE